VTAADDVRFVIQGGREAAAETRRALEHELGAELSPRLLYLVLLLGSELVADSVRHGRVAPGQTVAVAVRRDRERIRVEVMDDGPTQEIEPPRDDFPGGSPWSVFLIDQLADRWGAEADEGMTVWAEIERSKWEPAAAGA
jgi:anti-sigma regulatory factor (Ser/Thr protein kinase)